MNRMKIIISFILLALISSCTKDKKINQFLNDRYLALEVDYKNRLEMIELYIKEQPKNREEKVELASKMLDSLYQISIKNISESNNPRNELNAFIELARTSIWTKSSIDWSSYSEIPPTIEKEASLVAVAEIAKLLCKEMANAFGSDDFKFDKIGLFVEPEKTHLGKGENFKAKLFFAAYSSGYSEMVTIKVDGKEVELVNGVGQIDISPKNIGKNSLDIVATSNMRSDYWKGWKMERSVDFYVK